MVFMVNEANRQILESKRDATQTCLCLQVNALDTLGQTALHRAALAGHLQTCRLLLGYGADASLVSLQGFTAAQMGNEAVQQILNGTLSHMMVGGGVLSACVLAEV